MTFPKTAHIIMVNTVMYFGVESTGKSCAGYGTG
nr:MAG TPA: hypothetical protein [Caudoviricetes sp.]